MEEEDGEETMEVDENTESELELSTATLERLQLKAEKGEEPSLADLTESERREFHRAVASGALSRNIEEWQPWWRRAEASNIALRSDGTAKVAEVSGPSEDGASVIPAPPSRPLPKLEKIIAGQKGASSAVKWQVLEVLAAYCISLRFYNGEWEEDEEGAIGMLMHLSRTLSAAAEGTNRAPSTAKGAIEGCSSRAREPGVGCYAFSGPCLTEDLTAMLTGGRGVLVCALEHARRLMERALRWANGRRKKQAWRMERRIWFLEVWANERAPNELDELREHALTQGTKSRSAVESSTWSSLGLLLR